MSDLTLKPCPWCGREPRVFEGGAIQCETSECPASRLSRPLTPAQYAEAWNRRSLPRESAVSPSDSKALPEMGEQLRREMVDAVIEYGAYAGTDNPSTPGPRWKRVVELMRRYAGEGQRGVWRKVPCVNHALSGFALECAACNGKNAEWASNDTLAYEAALRRESPVSPSDEERKALAEWVKQRQSIAAAVDYLEDRCDGNCNPPPHTLEWCDRCIATRELRSAFNAGDKLASLLRGSR